MARSGHVATVCRYLFNAKSLYMFRVSPHPSSGILKTVTAASDTGHNIGTATSLQRDQVGILWPVPEATVTDFSTPDDGCCGHSKHVEWLCSKYLPTVASGWILLILNYDARNHELEICSFCFCFINFLGGYLLQIRYGDKHFFFTSALFNEAVIGW